MLLLAGPALMMASAASAGEQAELACIQQGYDAAQKAELDSLVGKVDILGDGNDPAIESLGTLVVSVATGCGTKYGWTDPETGGALLYEFGRLMELGFRRSGKLTNAEIAKIDTALDKGDRDPLWAALEAQIAQGMSGDVETVNGANAEIFGTFILELGIDNVEEDKAEQIGVYLAAKAMQRASARDFTSQ
jgi:hypothetical protein